MQLTKDDVIKETDIIEGYDDSGVMVTYINYNKFLQVRKFYEKWKDHDWAEELIHLWEGTTIHPWNDWLFYYCFVEGLKWT